MSRNDKRSDTVQLNPCAVKYHDAWKLCLYVALPLLKGHPA